jgi:hypothetical protein
MPRPRPALTLEPLEARDLPAAFDTLPIVPPSDPATADTVRAILARGQSLGRNPSAFLNAGDSNSAATGPYYSGYLSGLGAANYNPVASGLATLRPDLLDTLNTYRATGSFARSSSAAVPGYRTEQLLATLPGEIAATNAGVALVMIGTNHLADNNPEGFRAGLRAVVRALTDAGVVPILSTIPPSTGLGGRFTAAVPVLNQVIADVAAERHLPVWNLWRGLVSLPNGGLGGDGVHLRYAGDGGSFTGGNLAAGQNLRNLEALEVLAWFRGVVSTATDLGGLSADWSPLSPGQTVFASGRGEGQAPVVSVYDGAGRELTRFLAFDPAFTGGVRVATADVTGDGVPDVVVGAGTGGGPVVKVFSGADGALAESFFAFEPSFRTGVHVAAADLDGDGAAEVVVGAGEGGGPVVAVYHGRDLGEVARFFTAEPAFRGGVSVAAGVVAGVGPAVVTGAGVGGGPVVRLYQLGDPNPVLTYFAYGLDDRAGVAVGVVDLDGDGAGEVATAPADGAPHVRVTDLTTGADRASFFAPVTGGPGVRLGVLRDESGADALLIGNGPGSPVRGWVYRGDGPEPLGPTDPLRAYGVYLG